MGVERNTYRQTESHIEELPLLIISSPVLGGQTTWFNVLAGQLYIPAGRSHQIPCRIEYSVMIRCRNRFCGDVVLDSFNKTSWDFRPNKKQYVWIYILRILIFLNIIRNAYQTYQHNNSTKPQFPWSMLCVGFFFNMYFLSSLLDFKIFIKKDSKIFAFHNVGLKCSLYPFMPR